MLETTPWVLHPLTLVLRRRTHTSYNHVLGLWHTPQQLSTATINYPLRRTKKRMDDESKQHSTVDRVQSEQRICESAVITLAV